MTPSDTKPPLLVLILHWNRPSECLTTVESFLQQGASVSICVIDNASRQEELDLLKSRLPQGVELLTLPENKGWGGGLNVALRKWLASTTHDLCVVSAHDAILQPNCLAGLVSAMAGDDRLGVVCPQYPTPEVARFSLRRGIRIVQVSPQPPGTIMPVDAPHGTVTMFRKKCLQEIGLLDERYFAYGDEAEIGLRARRQGWGVAMVWGLIVINPGTWTPGPVVGYLSARNSLLMVRDYGGRLFALLRACLMILNSVRLLMTPGTRATMSSPRARMKAIRDYFLGTYGPPPADLVRISK